MKFFLIAMVNLVGTLAFADYAQFGHDVLCVGSDQATSIKVGYDKTEFPSLGRAGGIHVEINTGISELVYMANRMGLEKPYRQILRRAGAAGQMGNVLIQDKHDPFVLNVKLGFTTYDLIRESGEPDRQYASFISNISLSRIYERGFHNSGSADTQEFIQLRIIDDFGTHNMRFAPTDCKVLN